MISHVFVGVNDFPAALVFYSAVMTELGLILKFSEPDKPWAGWVAPNAPRPIFVIGKPYDGHKASAGNGQMIALLAPTRAAVDRTYAKALSLGGRCDGPPSLRPHYHPDYYGAYFFDIDGNKMCICCHDPIPA